MAGSSIVLCLIPVSIRLFARNNCFCNSETLNATQGGDDSALDVMIRNFRALGGCLSLQDGFLRWSDMAGDLGSYRSGQLSSRFDSQ